MEQIIYADILFIVNFSMDFLAIYITSKILHADSGFLSLILASCVGAVYGVAELFFSGNNVLDALINTSVAFLMCFIVFGAPRIIILIRNTLVFYGISFLMGGCMTGIFHMVNQGLIGRGIVINGDPNTLYSGISPALLAVLAGAAALFSYICSAVMKKVGGIKKTKVRISLNGKEIEFEGISDSGNLLCEPNGGLPVIIVSYGVIEDIIPFGLRSLFRDKNIGLLEFADPEIAKKIRIIPMTSVGSSGILVGMIPDKAEINGEAKNVCIACSGETKKYSGTDSIIPASVL